MLSSEIFVTSTSTYMSAGLVGATKGKDVGDVEGGMLVGVGAVGATDGLSELNANTFVGITVGTADG